MIETDAELKKRGNKRKLKGIQVKYRQVSPSIVKYRQGSSMIDQIMGVSVAFLANSKFQIGLYDNFTFRITLCTVPA